MTRRMHHARGVRLTLVGAFLAIAACQALPVAPKAPSAAKKPTATASRPASAAASATPKPTPSLGLLLKGTVEFDPAELLAKHLAELSDGGVRIVSNNGSGLISDNGLGLISDNGLGVIANNGGNYRVAATQGSAKRVQGMAVSAVSLLDGQVLAGPVASRADGTYDLGFVKVATSNMRIVATVPGNADEAFSYASLVKPTAKTAVNSDATRAVATMVLGLMPGYLQATVDKLKNAKPGDAIDDSEVESSPGFAPVMSLLRRIGQPKLKEIDVDGAFAKEFSRRIVAFVDLDAPIFEQVRQIVDDLQAYDDTHPRTQPQSLVTDIAALIATGPKPSELKKLMMKHGMPEPEAGAFDARVTETSKALGQLLVITMLAHQADVLDPFERFVPK